MAKTIGQLTQATTLASGDEFVIEQSGLTKRVAASVVRGGLTDGNIDAAAAISFSKLAALDSANILVGNGSNVATKVAVTGDVTISNAGVTAIGNSKVVTAMVNDAAITPAKLSQPLTLATAVFSSGTAIDFTGIPSWVRRLTVMFAEVSTNGSSDICIRIGTSGTPATSAYSSACSINATNTTLGSGFRLTAANGASSRLSGVAVISRCSSTIWVSQSSLGSDLGTTGVHVGGGDLTLSGNPDILRITTINGTDTFDAGAVNIMYEG
jgi:hypothetical protein